MFDDFWKVNKTYNTVKKNILLSYNNLKFNIRISNVLFQVKNKTKTKCSCMT